LIASLPAVKGRELRITLFSAEKERKRAKGAKEKLEIACLATEREGILGINSFPAKKEGKCGITFLPAEKVKLESWSSLSLLVVNEGKL
jgi:hypothetical protein